MNPLQAAKLIAEQVDSNDHTGAVITLAKATLHSQTELQALSRIQAQHERLGYLPEHAIHERNQIQSRLLERIGRQLIRKDYEMIRMAF
jgi:hypothetical protein